MNVEQRGSCCLQTSPFNHHSQHKTRPRFYYTMALQSLTPRNTYGPQSLLDSFPSPPRDPRLPYWDTVNLFAVRQIVPGRSDK